ncbi:GNAT family N-acetyltransferase [Streptomyces smaragdinus]|uniref:GNAT family N-acetyltransferase n=1 Tax=Streptomyces smaragdinus TaxID=2585196 RepID=UPI002B21E6A3|nr:GNAT family N-acetyltransferase [Streptomyces smaragdinus]
MTTADRPILERLLQLHLHDFSEFQPTELTPEGAFDYPWLDDYFTSANREAYLITADGLLAGFALIRCDVPGDDGAWNVSEFFVARGHRRRGTASTAARQLFQRHPGVWTLAFLEHNVPAARLWPTLAEAVSEGPVERVRKIPPEVPAAKSRLRFRVVEQAG